jgi:hypothetical protein
MILGNMLFFARLHVNEWANEFRKRNAFVVLKRAKIEIELFLFLWNPLPFIHLEDSPVQSAKLRTRGYTRIRKVNKLDCW